MWGFQGTICKKEKNFPIFTKYRWVHIPSVNLTKSARNSSFPNLKNQNERGIKSTEIRKRANSNRWIRSRRLWLGYKNIFFFLKGLLAWRVLPYKDMGHKVNIVSFHWQARWWACQNKMFNGSWRMITKVDKLSVYLRNTQPYDRVIGQRMEKLKTNSYSMS
jgi:hypothetical protein